MSKENGKKSSRVENYLGLAGAATGGLVAAAAPAIAGGTAISISSYKVCTTLNEALHHAAGFEEYATIIGYGSILVGVTYALMRGCKDNLTIFKACVAFGIEHGYSAGESLGRNIQKLFSGNKDSSGKGQPASKTNPSGYKYS